MSLQLLVLTLAAFGLVAGVVSGVIGLTLPLFDRVASQLRTSHRVVLWVGLSALPMMLAVFAILVSYFPAWGLAQDHCLSHGLHHPHLCPAHVGQAPGLALIFIAGFVAFRAFFGLVELYRTVLLSRRTARSLAAASTWDGTRFVFPSERPDAFVVGIISPRVFVSRALLALGQETCEPVVAHERVHARRRDSFFRSVSNLMGVGHLPHVAAQLRSRLVAAQEFTADEEGALSMRNGRVKMADAILTLAKLRQTESFGLAFTDGDLKKRITTLLETPRPVPVWPARALLLCALALPLLASASHHQIHHELETLLGVLS